MLVALNNPNNLSLYVSLLTENNNSYFVCSDNKLKTGWYGK